MLYSIKGLLNVVMYWHAKVMFPAHVGTTLMSLRYSEPLVTKDSRNLSLLKSLSFNVSLTHVLWVDLHTHYTLCSLGRPVHTLHTVFFG